MSSNQANWPYVINLGNSIIGVSILAMPFCFKECGVLLGLLLLLVSSWLTHTSCSLLLKGAFTSRRRSYEYLALHSFGPAGKLCVEISIIGLLIGTCVAFFVIIGDLGPAIISKIFAIENTWNLRLLLMVFLAFTVAFPLGLLKNLESLSSFSALSIGFYVVFILQVFTLAFPHLWSGLWVTKVVYWNPGGVFRCLPIFSLAFSCQTQLFVLYDSLHEASLKRMSSITKSAITMVTMAYLCVGFFGYVAFCDEEISGDVLLNFHSTLFTDAIKLAFVLSVAISFPLVIFPLRATIFLLFFFKQDHEKQTELTGPIFIPDRCLKGITLAIIVFTLLVGVCVPNIEFVLAMTGATMGSMISFIFPAVIYISVTSVAKSSGKSVAQLVLFLGFTILLASTYVTLNAQERQTTPEELGKLAHAQNPVFAKPDISGNNKVHLPRNAEYRYNDQSNKRHEPPNPQEPDASIKDRDATVKGDHHRSAEERKEADDRLGRQELGGGSKEAMEQKHETRDRNRDVEEGDKAVQPVQEKNNEAKELIEQLRKQQEVQQQLIDSQREMIEALKQHQKEAHGEVGSRRGEAEGVQADAGDRKEGVELLHGDVGIGRGEKGLERHDVADMEARERPIEKDHIVELSQTENEKDVFDQVRNVRPPVLQEAGQAQQDLGSPLKEQNPQVDANPLPINNRIEKLDNNKHVVEEPANVEKHPATVKPVAEDQLHHKPAKNINADDTRVYAEKEQKIPSEHIPKDAGVEAEQVVNENLHKSPGRAPEKAKENLVVVDGQSHKAPVPPSNAAHAQNRANDARNDIGDIKYADSVTEVRMPLNNAGDHHFEAGNRPEDRQDVGQQNLEAYLTDLLKQLAKNPGLIENTKAQDGSRNPDVHQLIKSLYGATEDQYQSQLQHNVNQLVQDPSLARALHNMAKNVGVIEPGGGLADAVGGS